MTLVRSDIFKFNQHVQTLVAALAARDATTHDLLSNLFVAYKAASDKTFREYAAQIESDIEDKKYARTAQQLHTKYRALCFNKKILWSKRNKNVNQKQSKEAATQRRRITVSGLDDEKHQAKSHKQNHEAQGSPMAMVLRRNQRKMRGKVVEAQTHRVQGNC
jgi:hypothetical protein